MIKKLATVQAVKVDSVFDNMWTAQEGGIRHISMDSDGVYINWNMGRTFVPFSNIRYWEE